MASEDQMLYFRNVSGDRDVFDGRHFDIIGKAQMLLLTLTMALFYSSVSLSHGTIPGP